MKNTAYRPLPVALSLAISAALLGTAAHGQTATKGEAGPSAASDIRTDLSAVGPSLDLTIGKSTLLRMPSAVSRISLGNPNVADVTLISPTELYLLGKTYGSTNLIVWRKGGGATAIDVNVNIDHGRMERKLQELLPTEKDIKVRPAADSVILTGTVSSAVKSSAAEEIANAYVRDVNKSLVLPILAGDTRVESGSKLQSRGGSAAAANAAGAKVVNLLQIAEGQQVMLEVTVAEVSKTLLDKMGARFNASGRNGDWTFGLASNLLTGSAGVVSGFKSTNGSGFAVDADKKDGLVKVLAEPNIVAVSGQEASFLAGGKIFIPVARNNDATGGSTITLEEKEFGVGLKFTPTVLEGGRIHLKVAPEVSELSQSGTPFTTVGGVTAVLPSFTTRRVQTSVQLMDGQSFAIAGLIKNNVTQSVDRVPGLGEVPILGALFRSSEFQGDRSELMFVITPRLVRPMDPNYILPTDGFTPPSRGELYFGHKLEGSGRGDVPADKRGGLTQQPAAQPAAAPGGMEVK